MTDQDPADESQGVAHSYLDVAATGPRKWVLAIGVVLIGLGVFAAFYGLYSINRSAAPTLTPDPVRLTQAVALQTQAPDPATPSLSPSTAAPTLTPSATPVLTPTAEPPTYTIQQGDSLIAIASRFNVDLDTLRSVNGISGEAIFPDQVLVIPPTVTPWPEGGPFPHRVSQGETLIAIAAHYSVTVDELRSLNGLGSDTILVGQQLLIPASGVRPPTPTPTPEPWTPAVITGDLDAVYSLTTTKGRYTLHIPPDTRAAAASERDKVATMVEAALEYGEAVLQRRFSGRFQVYVADAPFDLPYTFYRSFSLPDQNRLFLLYDEGGTATERLYFATYALSHLLASQKLGQAASPLLSEGLAVYIAAQALADATERGERYLPPHTFCLAFQQAEALPRVSRELTLDGHLGHLDQHLAAGCFVGYLIEEFGAPAFDQIYGSGDFSAVYERTLAQLETDWSASLADRADELVFDPDELVRLTLAVDETYGRLQEGFEGTPVQFDVYGRLNRAFSALLQGRLITVQERLEDLDALMGEDEG